MKWNDSLETCAKVYQSVATCLNDKAIYAYVVQQALLSTLSRIVQLVNEDLAKDVRKYKKHLEKRQSAKTKETVAKAKDAANKKTLRKHQKALERLERERLELENDSLKANIEQKRRQQENVREVVDLLSAKLSELKLTRGADFYFDLGELEKHLKFDQDDEN